MTKIRIFTDCSVLDRFCFRCTDDYPVHSETFPVSEYHRPIYQYLPLGYFETPRHVCDLIRDLIRLQCIYNFLLFHAMMLSVFDVLYALICYFILFSGLTY